MNSETSNGTVKKMVGEVLLDVVTMGLLVAAFGTMFYNGFIVPSERFTVGIMSAITIVGLLILFFIGTVSCMSTKVRKNALTAGFLTLAAFQVVALVGNATVLLCLLCKIFTVEDRAMRIGYLATVAVMIVGYVISIFSYSGGITDDSATEEAADGETDEEDVPESADEVKEDAEEEEDEEDEEEENEAE